MPRKLMAANASPVEIADAPPSVSARLSCGVVPAEVSVIGLLLLSEEDEHGHGVQTHHVVGSALGGDRALHVVRDRVRVAPEDLGQVHASAADDEIRDAVVTAEDL